MIQQVFKSTYADQYDLLYGDKDYSAECDLIESVFRHNGGTLRSILDLGCGTGNHAIPLAERGYQVTGVDRSEEMLCHARLKSVALSKPPSFVAGDVRSVHLDRTFDAVLMMFAVLGYQASNDDVLAALFTARQHLRPGGLFVFDVWYGPAVLAIRPSDRIKVIPVAEGRLVRAASGDLDVNRHLCAVSYQSWRLHGDRLIGEAQETHTMRYFFPMELEFFLRQSGFATHVITAFPSFEQPADETSWNVLVVAQ